MSIDLFGKIFLKESIFSCKCNLKMLINDGAISRELMELAGLNVGNYVVGKIFGDKEVKINCAAANFDIKSGLATTQLFVFDTENAIVYIDGTANMATGPIIGMKFSVAASAPRPAGFGIPATRQIRPVATPTPALIMVTVRR